MRIRIEYSIDDHRTRVSTCLRYTTIKSTRADDEISHEMFAEDTACVAAWCMPADHGAAVRTALSTPGGPSLFSLPAGAVGWGIKWIPGGPLFLANYTQ